MKKILSILAPILLTTSVSNLLHYESSLSLNENKTIIMDDFITSRNDLNDYGLIFVGSSDTVDLTSSFSINLMGDIPKYYKSIELPDLLATANIFSHQCVENGYSFDTNSIPYDVQSWSSDKFTIISVKEDWGSAHIEGAVYAKMNLIKTNINHITLKFNFYMHGVSWATQNWSYEYISTGNRLVFNYR